jgi:hypothetical protein
MKPTVQSVRESLALGPYFFSKDTLKFFGQTMRSFEVEWHDKDQGIIRLFAPIRSQGRIVGTTERFLDVSDPSNFKEV